MVLDCSKSKCLMNKCGQTVTKFYRKTAKYISIPSAPHSHFIPILFLDLVSYFSNLISFV